MKKLKICSWCEQEKVIWKNHEGKRYCQYCWYNLNPPRQNKKPKPIKPISEKRKEENKEYKISRLKYLLSHPKCEASLIVCTGYSTEIHHSEGRVGTNFLDSTKFLAVCHECHMWIELHPLEAKQLGLSGNRLDNN